MPVAYRRHQASVLANRLGEPPRHLQILAGPRQVGKTTIVEQVLTDRPVGSYLRVDAEAQPRLAGTLDGPWLAEQWRMAEARSEAWRRTGDLQANTLPFVLVIDEVQHVRSWSTAVKSLWDAASSRGVGMHVVLLGSAPLLVQRGLNESLTGRFELIPIPHWSFPEMAQCFGITLEQYLYFDGYPGSATLFADPQRWRAYINNSLIRASIDRDVLDMARVESPETLRRLFELGADHSGQVLAMENVQRSLGHGHIATLSSYLTLLTQAGLLTTLQKYSGRLIQRRKSRPKFQVMNNALFNVQSTLGFIEAQADHARWGRVVESAVGAHLMNTAEPGTVVHYWRESSLEVDFVVEHRGRLAAIEVKSRPKSNRHAGTDAFCRNYPESERMLVGGEELPLGEFFAFPASHWVTR